MGQKKDERIFVHSVDGKGMLSAVNEEWVEFARENGAPWLSRKAVVGRSLWDYMTGRETRHISRLLLDSVLRKGVRITIPYRCDSPGLCRYMEMEIAQVEGGLVEFRSSILRSEPREPVFLIDPSASRSGEFLTICSWCRRARVASRWVELEVAVKTLDLFSSASLPQLTHGICQECSMLVASRTSR